MSRRSLFRLFRAAQPSADHVPDAELLKRYARDRDSAAFELLVRRHADAVWAACFRVLRNEADADDAFQATFLVLARKAASVRSACVGGWLHRVAVNAALKLKQSRPSLSASEGLADRSLALRLGPDLERDELAAIVHEELARLPERYRLPVVLCDLEGHSHAEAAKVLNWPIGSVSGRLSRARDILRDRLTRRGVTAPAAFVGVLAIDSAPASAVASAASLAAGSLPVSPIVSALTEGVLSAMRTAKLKLAAAVVVVSGLLGLAGTGTVLAFTRSGPAVVPAPMPNVVPPVVAEVATQPPIEGNWTPTKPLELAPTAFPDLKPPPVAKAEDYHAQLAKLCPRLYGNATVTIEPTDDTYRRLLKARLHQGRMELARKREAIAIGKWTTSEYIGMIDTLEDMRATAQELWADDPKTLIPWLEECVIAAKDIERFATALVEAGSVPPQFLNEVQRHRLKVEAALWKVKNAQRQGGGNKQ